VEEKEHVHCCLQTGQYTPEEKQARLSRLACLEGLPVLAERLANYKPDTSLEDELAKLEEERDVLTQQRNQMTFRQRTLTEAEEDAKRIDEINAELNSVNNIPDIEEAPVNTSSGMTLIEEIIYDFLQKVPAGKLPTTEETQVISMLDSINSKYNS